jgi:biotin-(acetyl-CoA carboxylase) ligase
MTLDIARRHYTDCDSTNDLARTWACDSNDPAPYGAIVTADFQTKGRGRRGRTWRAAAGESILMSVVWDVPEGAPVSRLGLVAAVAVRDALAAVADDVKIKWPNDVLVGGGKAAGILVEAFASKEVRGDESLESGSGAMLAAQGKHGTRTSDVHDVSGVRPAVVGTAIQGYGSGTRTPENGEGVCGVGMPVQGDRHGTRTRHGARNESLWPQRGHVRAVIGIGVNVNQKAFEGGDGFVYPPISLRMATGKTFDRDVLIADIVDRLLYWDRETRLVEACRERMAMGCRVRRGTVTGGLAGLEDDGRARVLLSDGTFVIWDSVDGEEG